MTTNLGELLSQGIAAAQAGNRHEARALLTRVVEADDTQVEAWLWLSQIVDSLEEKSICLENILVLEPDHAAARQALAEINAQQSHFFRPVYAPGEETPPVEPQLPPAAVQPITNDYPDKDEFDDPWLCPYCIAPTRPQDRRCPACKRTLVFTARKQAERSVWLWRGIFLQTSVILFLFVMASASYLLLLRFNRIPQAAAYLPLYLGLPIDPAATAGDAVLELFPRWVFWGFAGAMVYSALLIPLLYFRVRHGNTVYLFSASLMLVSGITLLLFFRESYATLALGLFGFVIGVAQLLVTMNLWDDFKFQSGRLQLKIDPSTNTHASFYMSGRKYTNLEMWGLAALHLRGAVGRKPEKAVYQLALAIAYRKLGRDDLAAKAIIAAEKLDPTAPEIRELRQKLNVKAPEVNF